MLDDYGVYSLGEVHDRSGTNYVYVNNILFAVKYVDNRLDHMVRYVVENSQTLQEVYDNPSPAKINKYNLWKSWADKIRNLYNFGIVENSNKDFLLMGYMDLIQDLDRQAIVKIKPGRYLPDACVIIVEKEPNYEKTNNV